MQAVAIEELAHNGRGVSAPPKELENFFAIWRRASAPFALLSNSPATHCAMAWQGLRSCFHVSTKHRLAAGLACALAVMPSATLFASGQQGGKPASKQQQQQPAQPQLPDETNPPEEDESVAPMVYTYNPLEAQRCIGIGNFYMHKGSKGYRAALGRYEDATKYDPNSAEAFLKVGEVEEKLNNKDAAKIAFEKVVKLAPDSKFAKEARKRLGTGAS